MSLAEYSIKVENGECAKQSNYRTLKVVVIRCVVTGGQCPLHNLLMLLLFISMGYF